MSREIPAQAEPHPVRPDEVFENIEICKAGEMTFIKAILIGRRSLKQRSHRSSSAAKERSICAPCGTRTHDPRIRNPLLYPAELRAQLKSQLGTVLCSGVPARQGDLEATRR